jgi:hypothetical protein
MGSGEDETDLGGIGLEPRRDQPDDTARADKLDDPRILDVLGQSFHACHKRQLRVGNRFLGPPGEVAGHLRVVPEGCEDEGGVAFPRAAEQQSLGLKIAVGESHGTAPPG